MTYIINIPDELLTEELNVHIAAIEDAIRRRRADKATAKASDEAARSEKQAAKSKVAAAEALLKEKLKRSRGIYPHVDRALQQFERADGETVSVEAFTNTMYSPFPLGKHPAVLDNFAAMEVALLPNHPVVDGQIQNLRKKK